MAQTPAPQPTPPAALFDGAAFDRALADGAEPLAQFRAALEHGAAVLWRRFLAGAPAAELVHGRTHLIDQLIVRAWRRHLGTRADNLALVAVGGYGRGELLPHSDVDVMIVRDAPRDGADREPLEAFLRFLWDIGLDLGHSVRTVEDCVREATEDITVATNLMEARPLTGSQDLFEAMRRAVAPDRLWPSRTFFAAKWEEQRQRHHRYDDTAYNLEPNVKEGPGGLRDIHVVGWVAKRHFQASTLHDLVDHGFLTDGEYRSLIDGQDFLWRVRFALHSLTRRREDRLLFDHQRSLAELFGHRDAPHALAVEQFMQRYFRTITDLNRLNEMLLQLFQETILLTDEPGEPVPINRRFQARKGFLEITDPDVFRRRPIALIELFLLMVQRPRLKGVRASTIRAIRDHRSLIDDRFRGDLRARTLFIELLRQRGPVARELSRMNRYGVLAAYLPVFGNVVGQMQYDLFHVYPVDEHTLAVMRHIERFGDPDTETEFPLGHEIFQRLPKQELLYLAALFHDIGKGRGGDHSELGARDAAAFCQSHGLSRHDTRLVEWLVENHLLLSTTAQRRDISDPEVVNGFAQHVGDQVRLDYLYLLTMADIRGTNPQMWNSWKAALLLELYTETKRALRRGLEHLLDEGDLIRETREQALRLLRRHGLPRERAEAVWQDFPDEYFLRHRAHEIAWQTEAIAHSTPEDLPLVLIRKQTQRGSTAIFLYAPVEDHLFALITSVLDRLGLDIVDARIITSSGGYTLDTYLVLEQSGETITGDRREREILDTLRHWLGRDDRALPPVTRRPARQVRHFLTPTRIEFRQDERNARTVVEVYTADRPGLLSQVGRAFLECGMHVQNARVTTLGARTEDVFFVTDDNDEPLTDSRQFDCLRTHIVRYLDETLPDDMRASLHDNPPPRADR